MGELRMIHVAAGAPAERIWIPAFREALGELGELTVLTEGCSMTEQEIADAVRGHDVYLGGWGSVRLPARLAEDPGRLRYVCNITGGVSPTVPPEIIDSAIPVTNWGDAPAQRLAEGAFALLMALVKDVAGLRRVIREGGPWPPGPEVRVGTLEGLKLGLYGFGAIGRRFETLLRPFGPEVRVFDPYAGETPHTCERVESLEALFDASEAVAIHAGLSEETRHSVTADHLARLPDGGLVINTARGAIIDEQALFDELEGGRLRAGLDVLEHPLPADHPARHWENLILTGHFVGKVREVDGSWPQRLDRMHKVCLENLRRFAAGEALEFEMDRERFERST